MDSSTFCVVEQRRDDDQRGLMNSAGVERDAGKWSLKLFVGVDSLSLVKVIRGGRVLSIFLPLSLSDSNRDETVF